MAHSYLSGEALIASCAAGRGTIVLLEGESDHHDPYFYGRWFGADATKITFRSQNGWPKVVDGVRELRAALPGRDVFGIIDRDFADDSTLTSQEADGIFRTRRYTLENYLLEPRGWFDVVALLHRTTPPVGWSSPAEVAARIDDAYREPAFHWRLGTTWSTSKTFDSAASR